ncbi:plasmid stability protein [Pseudanabaena sp. FACHB-1277]|uniref:Plasmid stability protein n=1 Tax=Pseudanabaena cinerea FACHB-1277 TaxID=2949581 RepID=A0A926UZH7_9CYAN|nr:plasmid stability protein [Pseudanabaena cinerea]MBD2152877.1 plasmid stability protein [Pseudanabaena cinerea FACHB-1277]
MSIITIHQLEPDITQQLEQRAAQHGRTIELEIKAILKSVLAPKKPSNVDLATAINRRFADFGDFEIPEIPREPMRSLPTFDMGDL